MSTIVVVKKNGEVVIGADTLTKLGYTRESQEYIENNSKIINVGQNYIGSVGHASFALVLSHYFSSVDQVPSLGSPQEIFSAARDLHKALKDDYFLNPSEDEEDEFESSQTDCLIANKSGIFGLYRLRSVQEYKKFYAFGSGYQFAIGAMHAIYGSGASAQEIATAGLEAACDFDDSSGRPVELHTIRLEE